MSNLTIFKEAGAVSTASSRGRTALGQSLESANTMRRIQTNTNGTFRRIVGGEQIGKAIRGEFNCIIVDALPKVSRTYYEAAYDPNAKPTLPDCWSNLGDVPDAAASNPQSSNCASCSMNVKGSGANGGRACRFNRRIAILLEGDDSGAIYQLNIPGASLFGKGSGNVHPFESYVKFLLANGENPDTVVTNVSYDLDADTMQLQFTPVRGVTADEYDLVDAAQNDPETKSYVQLTVAAADGVTRKPKGNAPVEGGKPVAKAAKPAPQAEPDDEEEAEEVKPAPKPAAKPAAKSKAAWLDDEEEAESPVEEPVKRAAKPKAKANAAVEADTDLGAIMGQWGAADAEDEG